MRVCRDEVDQTFLGSEKIHFVIKQRFNFFLLFFFKIEKKLSFICSVLVDS